MPDLQAPPSPTKTEDFLRAIEVAVGMCAPPESSKLPSEDEPKMASLVDRLFKESDDAMWPLRRKWRLNEEFWKGNFLASWSWTNKRIETGPEDTAQPRVHLNVFRPTLTIWNARLLSTKPQLVIKAGSTDQSVIDAARLASRVVSEHEWRNQRMDQARQEFIHLLNLKGTAIIKLEWDPTAGKYLGKVPIPIRDENGQLAQAQTLDEDPASPTFGQFFPAMAEDGTPEWEVERDPVTGEEKLEDAWEGDNRCEVVDPEDFLCDTTVTDFRDAMWCMHVAERSCQWVYKRYKKRVKPDHGVAKRDSGYERVGPSITSRTKISKRYDESVLVKELHIQAGQWPFGPNEEDVIDLPQGYVIVVASGVVLSHGPNIYEHGKFPFIFRQNLKLKKELHGHTRADDIRSVQASILKTASSFTQNLDLMGNGQWLYTSRSGVKKKDQTNRVGAWIQHEARTQFDLPQKMPGIPASPSHERWLGSLKGQWLAFISGNNEGGMAGGVPPNVEAAAAFIELVERDATQLAETSLSYGLALQEWMEMTMSNVKQFWTQPRYVSVAGRGMGPEIFSFTGADVHDSFIYAVVPESVLPQSSAARFQKAFTLNQAQLLGKRDTLTMMGQDPHEEATLDTLMARYAQKEVFEAKTRHVITTPPELLSLSNPEVMIEEYARFLFDPTAQDDPVAFGLVLGRAIELRDAAVAQATAMQAAAQAPPGEAPQEAPPGEPEPASPQRGETGTTAPQPVG